MFAITREGMSQVTEKKSKFIARAFPVQTEEEALAMIALVKKERYDASHNVFAYRIGDRNEITRASDDGEPSGTAGLPVLDVLRGKDIQYALIVVTRYFGGTLLGTGGLVRCYGRAASDALADAGIAEKILCQDTRVKADYGFAGKIQHYAAQNGFWITGTDYTDTVSFSFNIEQERLSVFIKAITEITNGTAHTDAAAPVYMFKKATDQ